MKKLNNSLFPQHEHPLPKTGIVDLKSNESINRANTEEKEEKTRRGNSGRPETDMHKSNPRCPREGNLRVRNDKPLSTPSFTPMI
jgi:hypothetical protein